MTPFQEDQATIRKLRVENERLRAALKEIADDPGGYPAEDVFAEIRSIARRALEAEEQKP